MTTNRKRWYVSPPDVCIPSGIELGYFAGIIDGEGTISDYKNIRLEFVNTNFDVLDWTVQTIGGRIYRVRDRSDTHPEWKPCGSWIVTGANARVLIEALLPHLIIKKQAAEVVLANSATIEEGLRRRPH